jgi:hypothetical protein
MIPSLAVMVGLLAQAPTRAPEPVRVWRVDSTVYVTLREPGHVVLLHVDAIGRIRVLFPLAPDDSTSISGDAPVALSLPPTAQGNPSTFVAVRSRLAFEFAALRAGSGWNYHDALLLQPTGGDPLAALLEIADRVTDGRPYDYGVAEYLRGGTVAARREPLQPSVCLSCVRRGTPVATAPAAAQTNTVDCSNASLTNSFCGVANANVSITSVPQVAYQPAPPAAPAPVYVPYYLPIIVHSARAGFERPRPVPVPLPPAPSAPRPSAGAAFPIAPRLIVPSSAELRTYTGRRP